MQTLSPPESCRISSPVELEALLRVLQQLLADGTLRQAASGGPTASRAKIADLPPAGPWPDIIEADLADVHGQAYHLFVDCYHGAGGEWRATGQAP